MKIRPLLAVACVAALGACNQAPTANTATPSTTGNSATGTAAAPAAPAAPARAVDPQLEREISMAVEMLRPQLPIRQGPVTVTNIEARGGELIYSMEVPNDLDAASFANFQQQLPVQACANPQAQQLFQRGGSYTYILKDPSGEEFRTSVTSC